MSVKSKFLVFVALPVSVLTVAAVSTSSFTFGQTISTALTAEQEQVDYLFPATSVTSANNAYNPTATLLNGSEVSSSGPSHITVQTKYGELPQWTQITNGGEGVPSTIQQPGDLLYINARSSTSSSEDTNGGLLSSSGGNSNDVAALNIKGNIVNLADLRGIYSSCLIPLRLWKTVDRGDTWTDVTNTYFTGNAEGEPYYIDCDSGAFQFTVPTGASADGVSDDLDYAVTVEAGGNFATMTTGLPQGSDIASPKFLFRATPIAKATTNG